MSENLKTKTFTRWVVLSETEQEHYQQTGSLGHHKLHKTQQEAEAWLPNVRVLYRQYGSNPPLSVVPVEVTRYTYPSLYFQALRGQWADNASARFLLVVWVLALPAFIWGLVTTGTAMLADGYFLVAVLGLGGLVLLSYGLGSFMDMSENREEVQRVKDSEVLSN